MSDQAEVPVLAIPLREALICGNCDTVFSAVYRECPRCSGRHPFPLQRIIRPAYEDRTDYLEGLAERADEREAEGGL